MDMRIIKNVREKENVKLLVIHIHIYRNTRKSELLSC